MRCLGLTTNKRTLPKLTTCDYIPACINLCKCINRNWHHIPADLHSNLYLTIIISTTGQYHSVVTDTSYSHITLIRHVLYYAICHCVYIMSDSVTYSSLLQINLPTCNIYCLLFVLRRVRRKTCLE